MPEEMRKQLEVFWIISVTLFGDYGVSPRVGWIEDTDGFYVFIDKITESYLFTEENKKSCSCKGKFLLHEQEQGVN